jgi:AraC-like DNA-binding protein
VAAAPLHDTDDHVQTVVWRGDGIYMTDDDELRPPPTWEFWRNEGWGLGIARSGAYRRMAHGIEQVVDTNTGFLRCDGDEVGLARIGARRVDDVTPIEPNKVTFISVDPDRCDIVAGADTPRPDFAITPEIDLLHRQLRNAHAANADTLTLEAASLSLIAAAVGQRDQRIRSYSRRTTESEHRRLVSGACDAIHANPSGVSLLGLAKSVGCSPFHLSRVFREITGLTIPQYRNRLRVHEAMSGLAAGDDDLAALAARTGFADHSHMTRSIVAQYGKPPSRIRELLMTTEIEMLRFRR